MYYTILYHNVLYYTIPYHNVFHYSAAICYHVIARQVSATDENWDTPAPLGAGKSGLPLKGSIRVPLRGFL